MTLALVYNYDLGVFAAHDDFFECGPSFFKYQKTLSDIFPVFDT